MHHPDSRRVLALGMGTDTPLDTAPATGPAGDQPLAGYLRTGRVIRRPKGVRLPDGRGGRPNTLHISQGPPEAEDRAVPGHWEGDVVFGKGMSPVATLVERKTRYLMLVALAAAIARLPQHLAKSLTWDLGHEMAQHQRFTIATGVQVYFCDPKSPWQRGSNENTNGLLRQYLPRRIDFRTLGQADLDTIAQELDERPRQTQGFRTPSQALAEVCCVDRPNPQARAHDRHNRQERTLGPGRAKADRDPDSGPLLHVKTGTRCAVASLFVMPRRIH
jgi:hypothetical protein